MNIFLTITLTLVIMLFAIISLAIGWIVTGKTRLKRGCGFVPSKKKGNHSEKCSLCGDKKDCNKADR